jgi:hypothetical protein
VPEATGGQIYLRYTYPQVLGTAKPFSTNTVAPRRAETLLPHSYATHQLMGQRRVVRQVLPDSLAPGCPGTWGPT